MTSGTSIPEREKIAIRYKCACMTGEAIVDVPAREEDEEITDWVLRMQRWIGDHHSQVSPFCREMAMEYLKVPMPENAPYVGAPPRLDS